MNRLHTQLGTFTLTSMASALLVLLLAALLGRSPSVYMLGFLVALIAGSVVARDIRVGLLVLPAVALFVPLSIGTGTDVSLNSAVLAVPALTVLWLIKKATSRDLSFADSRLYRPLIAFLLVTGLALLSGNAMWSAGVPRPANALIVQLGQISIYALSFLCFWLTANLINNLIWLRRLAYSFISILGIAIMLHLVTRLAGSRLLEFTNGAWLNMVTVWLVGLCLTLATTDRSLRPWQRVTLVMLATSILVASPILMAGWVAGWAPPWIAAVVVVWISFPKFRLPMVLMVVASLVAFGPDFFLQKINIEEEWSGSGGSRLALWRSVAELGMLSPMLGLGPVAYRYYHYVKPLQYLNAYWFVPTVSAHNMFIDLFAQIGLLGLGCYVWFLVEAAILAYRLYCRSSGFARGYALAAMGAMCGIFFSDILAENSLPFVYNNGFSGFRASVLSWMLMGGLVVLENLDKKNRLQQ